MKLDRERDGSRNVMTARKVFLSEALLYELGRDRRRLRRHGRFRWRWRAVAGAAAFGLDSLFVLTFEVSGSVALIVVHRTT